MYKSTIQHALRMPPVVAANRYPHILRTFSTATSAQFIAEHDPSEIKKKFRATLEQEREQAILGGGEKRIQKQHARGSLTARERLELLFDKNSFHELDQLKSHRCTEFDMDTKKFPGDGIGTCCIYTICIWLVPVLRLPTFQHCCCFVSCSHRIR